VVSNYGDARNTFLKISAVKMICSQVAPYPSDAELQSDLLTHVDWVKHRERVLVETIEDATVTRVRNRLSTTTSPAPLDFIRKLQVQTMKRGSTRQRLNQSDDVTAST
jgi:hypothetical protein